MLLVTAVLLLLACSSSPAHAQQASDAGSPLWLRQQPGQQQLALPQWVGGRATDVLLNFSTADAAARVQEAAPISFRGQLLAGVSHRKGYFYGNVAAVRFGGQLVLAVRKIQFHLTPRTSVADYPPPDKPDQKWISWWTSRISVCTADAATLQPLGCADYEPRNWTECMWNGGFESLGPEDPRLIVWPSKGLFLMFVSKPWPVNPTGTKPGDTACAGPWAQQPWLVPLATYQGNTTSSSSSGNGSSSSSGAASASRDPWTSSGVIRLQYLPAEWLGARLADRQRRHAAKGGSGPLLHKQKNWNPFIYRDELYFSQSFMPHVVIKPAPDGSCRLVHTSDGAAFKQLPARPRGNTQAVLVPAGVAGGGGSTSDAFYLGIVHTEVERRYSSHFYKMEAEPPFAITAVSAPLALHFGSHPRVPAWRHIAFPMSLQLLEDTAQLMIGYGSGDQAARLKVMPLAEALQLFDQATPGSGGGGGGGAQGGSSSGGDKPKAGGRSASAASAAAAAVATMEALLGRRLRWLLG